MEDSFALRRATEEDRSFVYTLMRESLGSYFTAHSPEGWCDEKFHAGYRPERIRIVERDGRPIGFFDLEIEGDGGHLRNVHIAAEYRGRGIGTALLRNICREAVSAGLRRIHGKIFSANEGSRRWCRRNGFLETGILPDEESVLIELRLDRKQ